MDEDFAYFYDTKAFGPARDVKRVSEANIERHRGVLPDQMLAYWREHGWAGYGNGLFWLTDPEIYRPVVDAWLAGTSFRGGDDYHVIARGAFGQLYLWGRRTGPSLYIRPSHGWIFPHDRSPAIGAGDGDFLARCFFSQTVKKEVLDETDDGERPLFERAREKLGDLAANEMYGFAPALKLGGAAELASLRKVEIVEHLVMLAGLEREVMQDIVQVATAHGLLE